MFPLFASKSIADNVVIIGQNGMQLLDKSNNYQNIGDNSTTVAQGDIGNTTVIQGTPSPEKEKSGGSSGEDCAYNL